MGICSAMMVSPLGKRRTAGEARFEATVEEIEGALLEAVGVAIDDFFDDCFFAGSFFLRDLFFAESIVSPYTNALWYSPLHIAADIPD
jgi:hypothetical protein